MRYGLLGSLQVLDQDGAALRVPSGKQCALLAALLLRPNQVLAAETLIDVLWAEDAPASARAGLSTYMARLRDALGPAIGARLRSEGRGYVLDLGPDDEIDYLRAADLETDARNAATEGRWSVASDAAAKALELWRGEALADVESAELRDRFLPFLAELRLRLEQLRVDAHLAVGAFEAILPTLQRLTDAEPFHEPFREREFVALYGAGRNTDAQALFRRVRILLREELGTEPSSTLRRFHQLSLNHVPAADLVAELIAPGRSVGPPSAASAEARETPPVREPHQPPESSPALLAHQLPLAPRRFIGREAELAQLCEAMAGNHPPYLPGLTLLVGMAGVGKTALALTWAHRSAADFPDGRLYLDLRGFAERGRPLETDEAVRILLDCLGVPGHQLPATAEGRIALYRATVADKRLLIVLDNVRHPEQVRPLLPQTGPGQVLATSRSTLASLVTIDFARTVTLEPFTAEESVKLLNLRLGPARTEGHEAAVAAIAQRCARLPLALVVAAGRAWTRPDIPLEDLATDLGAADGGLAALDGGDAVINVRTVLSWSYRQLSPCAARVFRLLALHPGPDASVAAAASLAGVPLPEAHAALVELASMNMANGDRRGRYRRHSLLEAFAAERMALEETEDERRAAYRRLADSYLHSAINANRHIATHPISDQSTLPAPASGADISEFSDSLAAITWFDNEREVLAAMVADTAASGLDLWAWQLTCAQSVYLSRRSSYNEELDNGRIALEAAGRLGDPVAEAHIHRHLARAHARLGDTKRAFGHLDLALEFYTDAADDLGVAETYRTYGNVLSIEHRFDEALEAMRHYREYTTAVGHLRGQTMALNSMGFLMAHAGRPAEALPLCREALAIALRSGRTDQIGLIWDSLGLIHHRLGDLKESASCYHRAIDFCLEEGDLCQAALAQLRLGDVLRDSGDAAGARREWSAALAVFEELRRPEIGETRARLAETELLADDANGFAETG